MTYVEKSAIMHDVFRYDYDINNAPEWVKEACEQCHLYFSELGLLIKTKNKRGLTFFSLVKKGDYLCKTNEGVISIDGDYFEKNYVRLKVL